MTAPTTHQDQGEWDALTSVPAPGAVARRISHRAHKRVTHPILYTLLIDTRYRPNSCTSWSSSWARWNRPVTEYSTVRRYGSSNPQPSASRGRTGRVKTRTQSRSHRLCSRAALRADFGTAIRARSAVPTTRLANAANRSSQSDPGGASSATAAVRFFTESVLESATLIKLNDTSRVDRRSSELRNETFFQVLRTISSQSGGVPDRCSVDSGAGRTTQRERRCPRPWRYHCLQRFTQPKPDPVRAGTPARPRRFRHAIVWRQPASPWRPSRSSLAHDPPNTAVRTRSTAPVPDAGSQRCQACSFQVLRNGLTESAAGRPSPRGRSGCCRLRKRLVDVIQSAGEVGITQPLANPLADPPADHIRAPSEHAGELRSRLTPALDSKHRDHSPCPHRTRILQRAWHQLEVNLQQSTDFGDESLRSEARALSAGAAAQHIHVLLHREL